MTNHASDELPPGFPFSADQALFEEVLNELGVGVAVISRDYRVLWASNQVRGQYGELVGEFCFKSFRGRGNVCTDDCCCVRRIFDEGFDRLACEHVKTDLDGRSSWSHFRSKALRDKSGEIVAVVEISEPITARKRAEEALRARGERLDSIIRVAPIGIGLVIDRIIVDANDRLCEMTGYSVEELLHQPSRMLYPNQEEYDRVGRDKCGQFRESGTGSVETLWLRKDRTLLNVYLKSTPLDRDNLTKGVIFTALDTTEWHQTQEALRRSEEKYRQVVEHANDAIFIAQDGRVKFPNPQMLKGTGYSEDELTSESFIRFIHPEDRGLVLERYRRRLMGEDNPAPYTFRAINKAGETLWVELTAVRINWEGRPASLTFARDITGQKKLEAQLIQSQKMEAIGTLAGGVAHDFNNLLTGILGFTSLMLRTMPPEDPNYVKIQNIETLGRSGAELTKQLLGFARGGKYEVRTTDLNELVLRTLGLFGRTKKEINIHHDLQPDLPAIEVDGAQIEQVIVNLFVNAFQAMPMGGDLFLETRRVTLAPEFCWTHRVDPGDFVQLTVTDTGEGMDEATQRRVFEPFFTTKGLGRGTGLGLASSYGIVKNHGGLIDVSSEVGHGTTFRVCLPAAAWRPRREKGESVPALMGAETILLVDDEDVILNVGREILTLLGYSVLTAKSGSEAIAVYEQRKNSIDLVILDVAMPGMTGGETFDQLRAIDPRVRVLLSSGYSFNGEAEDILARGGNGFLQKPYTVQEASVKIRSALRSSR